LVHGGIGTRAGAGTTWRVEKSYRDLKQTIALSEEIATAVGGAEVARWAALCTGD
jgi:hypothetical protein